VVLSWIFEPKKGEGSRGWSRLQNYLKSILPSTEYYWSDELDRACVTRGTDDKCSGNLKETDYMQNLGVDYRMTLK